MRHALWSAVAVVVLGGCATMEAGASFDLAAAAGFQPGQATRAEVEAALGPPVQVTQAADGTTTLGYSHIVSRANGFTGKAAAQGQAAVFVFDANGVLQRKSIGSPSAGTR
jgi:hypothetical protein